MYHLMMKKLLKTSPAKLNLFLYVVGRDKREYHILQSLFCTIPDLYDIISFEQSNKLEVISNIKNNIIEKAARSCGVNNLKISLDKKIPIGSGLGGGSSNAATTLIEIGRNLNLTKEELINKNIGDDVKFFLYEKNAIYFDSDQSYEVNLGISLHLVLVIPDFSIATQDVYDVMRDKISNIDELSVNKLPALDKELLKFYIFNGVNQLYPFTKVIEPRITNVINEISTQQGVLVSRMSGSGSSCFGIFDSYDNAIYARTIIQENNPKWKIDYFNLKI